MQNSGRNLQPFDDFSDMKQLFGDNLFKVIADMTAPQHIMSFSNIKKRFWVNMIFNLVE
jgi:hypothetical protein